jgi:dUTP pyrophosphatase
MKVKIINRSGYETPRHATAGSAGIDLRSAKEYPITLKAGERLRVPTGIFLEMPQGIECQVRGRSSLAFNHGILSFNGTIDSDYRGEIIGLLFNTSKEDYIINPGDRICQIVFNKLQWVNFEEVEELEVSERNTGAFGSTGK